jgi:exodeoxyribonuclease V beta subunit
MDRLKKAPPSRAPIIYEYEGIELQNIYLRMSGREELDPRYANALQKERELSRQDNLNALYVAFTRARENLFIITKSKDSLFEQLDLTVETMGTLHVNKKEMPKKEPYKALEYEASYYGMQSDILAVAKQEDEDQKAINFGLALHYCLEMLHSFEQSSLHSAYEALRNKFGAILEEEELFDIVKRVTTLLENKEFLELSDGECMREKGMLVEGELRFMDLLVQKADGSCNIIDYKSSEHISENHIKQVKGYIRAVKMITCEMPYGYKDVSGYLCYLRKEGIFIKEVK